MALVVISAPILCGAGGGEFREGSGDFLLRLFLI